MKIERVREEEVREREGGGGLSTEFQLKQKLKNQGSTNNDETFRSL